MRVRTFLSFVVVLTSVPVFASQCGAGDLHPKTLNDVCSRTRNRQKACFAAGAGAHLDACGLGICDTYKHIDESIECVGAVANRYYTLPEILKCHRLKGEDETTNCLARLGKDLATHLREELAIKLGESHGKLEAEKLEFPDVRPSAEEQGKKAGLAQAQIIAKDKSFRTGYAMGRTDGAKINPEAYTEGIEDGKKRALEPAWKFGHAVGYREAYQAALEKTPENSLSIDLADNHTEPQEWAEQDDAFPTQQAVALPSPQFPYPASPQNGEVAPGRGENFIPVDAKLPAPKYTQFEVPDQTCREMYTESYQRGFQVSCRQKYSKVYVAAFNQGAKVEFDAAVNKPDELAQSQGVAQGARTLGIIDGYKTQYPISENEAKSKGRLDFEDARQRGFIVQVRAMTLSTVGQSSFVPGSQVHMDVEIDNLGGKAVPPGLFRLRETELARVDWQSSTRVLPAIPANTRVKFLNVLVGSAGRAFTGEPLASVVALETLGSVGIFHRQQLFASKVKASFPVELIKIEPETAFEGDKPVVAQVLIRNVSDKPTEKMVGAITSMPAAIRVSVSERDRFEVSALQPGQELLYRMTIQPSIWTTEGAKTNFLLALKDEKGETVSLQKYGFFVSRNLPVSLVARYENRVISNLNLKLREGEWVPITIEATCRADQTDNEGYSVRYAGFDVPGLLYQGTTSMEVNCKQALTPQTMVGKVRLTSKDKDKIPGIKFELRKRGQIVQGLQIFAERVP